MMTERYIVSEYTVDDSSDGRKDVYHIALEEGGLYTARKRDEDDVLMGMNLDSEQGTGRRLFSLETIKGHERPLYVAFLASTAFRELQLENTKHPVQVATHPRSEMVDGLVKEALGLFLEDRENSSGLLVQDSRVASGFAQAALRRNNAKRSRYVPGTMR